MKIGFMLPSRAPAPWEQMRQLAKPANASDRVHSIWVGDSLPEKPRVENIAVLASVARRLGEVLPALEEAA